MAEEEEIKEPEPEPKEEPVDQGPDFGEHRDQEPTNKTTSSWRTYWEKVPSRFRIPFVLLWLLLGLWLLLPTCSSPPPTNKTYQIAVDDSWWPLRLQDKQYNMTAFIRELTEHIAKQKNLRIHLFTTTSNLFNLADRGEADGVISILPPPYPQDEHFIVSDALYQLGFVVVVRTDSTLTNSSDITNRTRRIGIVDSAKVLVHVTDYPNVSFTTFTDIGQAITALDKGYLDGIILDNLKASTILLGLYSGKFKILARPIINEGIELYMKKDKENKNFISFFNEGLSELRENGEYAKLITQWGLVSTVGE